MNQLRAAIIDDEDRARQLLTLLLEEHTPDVKVVFSTGNPAEGLNYLKTSDCDVVFLDIEMPGTTGFQLLEQLGEIDCDVIFTTAYGEYAIKAIRYSAIDYLLKPIDTEELKAAIGRVSQKGNKKGGIEPQQLEILMGLLKNTDKAPIKITIPTLEGFLFVPVADIIHCLGDTNYTHIHLKDGQKILSSKSLKVYEEMLAPNNFFRIHKSHLINMSYLTKYVKGEGGRVIMTDGSELEVSRRKKEEFLGKIGRAN